MHATDRGVCRFQCDVRNAFDFSSSVRMHAEHRKTFRGLKQQDRSLSVEGSVCRYLGYVRCVKHQTANVLLNELVFVILLISNVEDEISHVL